MKEEDRNVAANANFGGTYRRHAVRRRPDYAPDVFNNAYYYGIRRYPYSRDMTKNPLTFKHIANGNSAAADAAALDARLRRLQQLRSAQHRRGVGTMLWECYATS